jgi:hypothetical protein
MKRVPKFPLRTEADMLGRVPEQIGLDVTKCREILADYFAMVADAILDGARWYFPDGSSLYIGWEDAPGVCYHKYSADGKKTPAYNLRRLNKDYSIVFCGPLVNELKFTKSTRFGSRLFKVLTQTDVEFRYKENEH